MPGIHFVGFGSFLLVGLVYGLRLLRPGTSTRDLSETLASVAMLCLGPLGYGALNASRVPGLLRDELVLPFTVIGALGLSLGAAALFLMVMQVFRRTSLLARWVGYTALALLCVSSVGDVIERIFSNLHGGGVLTWTASAMRLLAVSWSAAEALNVCRKLRARVAAGAMDPLLAGQIGLWGAGMLAIAAAFGVSFAVRVLTGQSFMMLPAWNTTVAILAGAAACLFGLAFLPPPPYLRWLKAGGQSAS